MGMRQHALGGMAALMLVLGGGAVMAADELPTEPRVLPRQPLFDPLIADPRWPHFAAALHDYGGDSGLENVGSVGLGNGFSFYQEPGLGGAWGVGLQAAVFAIFDLDAESKDLINADYWVGLPVAWRAGPWSAIVRLYHQSSHLGDEYLLRDPTARRDRLNLSYEAVDVRVARSFWEGVVRLYGGGGMLLHREPEDLDRFMAQAGVELRSPWTIANGHLRPIAALDLQGTQESGWEVDKSVRVGVQLEGRDSDSYRLQLTLEYYQGRNPNGQFYSREVEFWGLGLHAYF